MTLVNLASIAGSIVAVVIAAWALYLNIKTRNTVYQDLQELCNKYILAAGTLDAKHDTILVGADLLKRWISLLSVYPVGDNHTPLLDIEGGQLLKETRQYLEAVNLESHPPTPSQITQSILKPPQRKQDAKV